LSWIHRRSGLIATKRTNAEEMATVALAVQRTD
jgi:hypothetical protein